MSVKITRYNKGNGDNLLAWVSIYFEKQDMTLNDCKIIRTREGQRFVGFPSREYTDKEGVKKYSSYVFFGDKFREKVQEMILAAFDEYEKANPQAEQAPFQAESSQQAGLPF